MVHSPDVREPRAHADPFKLPLSTAAITLPTNRPNFISEILATHDIERKTSGSFTPAQTPDVSVHGERRRYLSQATQILHVESASAV